ncbi:glipr2 family protein [Megaselia abdita]
MRRSITPHNETQSIVVSTNDARFIDRKTVSFSHGSLRSSSQLSLHRNNSPSPALSGRNRSSGVIGEFEMDCLRAHNEFRNKHGVKSLKINVRLCKFAEEWAINLASRVNPIHRSNSPYGENIFCTWSNSPHGIVVDGKEPVEHWYGEVETHIFNKEPTTLRTGHFTQVVWKDSKELGVGKARSKTGQVVIVCNYDPPGNFIGSFTENVPPLGGFPEIPRNNIYKNNGLSGTSLISSGCGDEFNDFSAKMLKWHNYYRKKHGVPLLNLNLDLCSLSQDWTETLAKEDRFAYRPNCNYGENIYCLWSSDRSAKVDPRDICRSWYEENKEHNYYVEPKGLFRAGHFTQMVWKATEELGVGIATTKKGKVLIVCNYKPRGNTIGEFMFNVVRPH